ncbi:MAG: ATP-binding cassette domain-containing protein [Methylococcaceae bacterium]|nr:ATP-binding cassette domain-containing protein [Methylococcaceae bacterium]
MAEVEFRSVGKTFPNGHRALWELNLTIADGELLVVVGPSGCGKSTLLRLLAGLEEIGEGEIRIDGRLANPLTPQQRNVAMVFQDYALYPNMTVRENLAFPLQMRKLDKTAVARRVADTAAMLELGELLERYPRQLSGGQRQRVAMGRALVREPSVFLMDEPLSNLDAKLRVQVRSEIAELQKRLGTTMVYVTHDQVEAMTLGRRIAVLHQGRLQQVADPQQLYDRPATPFVAGFIGNPPMNLVRGMLIRGEDGSAAVTWGNQPIALPADRLPPGLVRGETTWGVRPEALVLSESGQLRGVVRLVEYLGHETLVHLVPEASSADAALIVRAGGLCRARPGDCLGLQVPEEAIVVFAV